MPERINDKVVKTLKTNFSRVKKLPCEGRLLEEGLLEGHWGTKFNALEWWNVHQLKYPILSKMAKDVLAIPISTVASEATFSAGGRVIDPYRSALKSNTVEMLLCGGDWIRQNYGIKKKVKTVIFFFSAAAALIPPLEAVFMVQEKFVYLDTLLAELDL
ncbi:zinc finger BED domain-containing protein RICESLEEPER 2-like protein [Tanacetum coccineum]